MSSRDENTALNAFLRLHPSQIPIWHSRKDRIPTISDRPQTHAFTHNFQIRHMPTILREQPLRRSIQHGRTLRRTAHIRSQVRKRHLLIIQACDVNLPTDARENLRTEIVVRRREDGVTAFLFVLLLPPWALDHQAVAR